jgi:hypothetical protein
MDLYVTSLRIIISATMVLFGIDQITNPNAWTSYVPDKIAELTHMNKKLIIRVHSFGNLILGVLFGTGVNLTFTTWATLIWWVSILPFAFLYDWRIGLRDTAIVGALALILQGNMI